jgi:hypothetical protein
MNRALHRCVRPFRAIIPLSVVVIVALTCLSPPVPSGATQPPGSQFSTRGYWEIASDGGVFSFGDAPFYGSTASGGNDSPIVGMAPTYGNGGYWEVEQSGGLHDLGDATGLGSSPGFAVGITPHGSGGFREASADGSVFTQDSYTSVHEQLPFALNKPIVDIAENPGGSSFGGGGYWLVANDGGVFGVDGAPFFGSMGGKVLDAPIVGIAATADGGGYWLVAADGGVFAFGDAPYLGSMGGKPLNKPIVGIASSDSGGYWLVASDGGVFAFGDAPFLGSMGGQHLNAPITGIAAENPILIES